MGMKKFLRISI